MRESDRQNDESDVSTARNKSNLHPRKRLRTNSDMSLLSSYDRSTNLKVIVKYLVSAIVDDSEKVSVQEFKGGQSSLIEVKVSNQDIGLVVGREGKTAEALRIILRGSAAKLGRRAILNIMELKPK